MANASRCALFIPSAAAKGINAAAPKETLERQQSCEPNGGIEMEWQGLRGANVVLHKAQMVPARHVTEKWGDGGICREECVGVRLSD